MKKLILIFLGLSVLFSCVKEKDTPICNEKTNNFEERIIKIEQSLCEHKNIIYEESVDSLVFLTESIMIATEFRKTCKDCDKKLKVFRDEKEYLIDRLKSIVGKDIYILSDVPKLKWEDCDSILTVN